MRRSSTILHKRSSVLGATPSLTSLSSGEIAINTRDGKLFVKTVSNSIKTFLNANQLPYTLDESLSSVNFQYGNNTVTDIFASVLNGVDNDVSGGGSTVINGSDNDIAANYALIGNGSNNKISVDGEFGAILGGENNNLNHPNSFILGSNITSHLSGFTYVENLSAIGKFYGDGSELTGIISGDTVATTLVRTNSANWNFAYDVATDYQAVSSNFLTSETDSQQLSFDEATKELTITNGNKISLSALSDLSVDNEVRSLTGKWDSTYTTVQASSANWDTAYNISSEYQTVSSTFLTAETDSQTLTFDETNKELTISNGNTVSLSALIDSSIDTGVRALTTNWENTFTHVQANSSNWNTSYFSTTALNLSSNIWNSTYTLVESESANWGTGGVAQNLSFDESTSELSLTLGNTVSLSSLAGAGGDPEATTLVRSNSANWDSTYTTVQSNSANWQTTFQASSAYVSSNPTGITGASSLTKILQITQAGYNAITPASDTLYIIVG